MFRNSQEIPLHAATKARKAFEQYVAWNYANPSARRFSRLLREHVLARTHTLDSEAKAYLSVMINEFHRTSVSTKDGKEY